MSLTPLPPFSPSPGKCASGAYFLPYWPWMVPFLLSKNSGRTLSNWVKKPAWIRKKPAELNLCTRVGYVLFSNIWAMVMLVYWINRKSWCKKRVHINSHRIGLLHTNMAHITSWNKLCSLKRSHKTMCEWATKPWELVSPFVHCSFCDSPKLRARL